MNMVKRTPEIFVGIVVGLVVILALGMNFAIASTTTEIAAAETPANTAATAAISPSAPGSGSQDTPPAPEFGEGMKIPVDGTSLDAFEQSLATIKTKTTSAEYTTLVNAIDYLMVYHMEARRDRTKLAALLNGKTGEQIVGMVAW
jgi:hypothetical protein